MEGSNIVDSFDWSYLKKEWKHFHDEKELMEWIQNEVSKSYEDIEDRDTYQYLVKRQQMIDGIGKGLKRFLEENQGKELIWS